MGCQYNTRLHMLLSVLKHNIVSQLLYVTPQNVYTNIQMSSLGLFMYILKIMKYDLSANQCTHDEDSITPTSGPISVTETSLHLIY